MAIDWTQIYEKYKGLWVALKDDEQTVISSGKTLREAVNRNSQAVDILAKRGNRAMF